MCGIVGYWGRFDPEALKAANQMQGHRGPDDSGLYFDQRRGLGLGHTRLAILDLSAAGHQPMISQDGRVVLVYNGEVYNFRELRAELEKKGFCFQGTSDTEVLLQLYRLEGLDMLPRLQGIFALCIWDQRDEAMYLARDGLGVKPAYYYQGQRGLAFASEIKALLPLMPRERELDPVALHRYLSFLWSPGSRTPFKSVRKLVPGQALKVQGGQIAWRWIWYKPALSEVPKTELDQQETFLETSKALKRAVHRQLVADVPVGAFLSGGLDSSAIAALARGEKDDLRCFTIEPRGGHEPGEAADLPYARKVAKYLGLPLEVVQIDSQQMAADMQQMVFQLDEPLADPAPLNVLYISRLARQSGYKVLLSGAGGDDLFTGYRRHLAVRYEGLWQRLPQGMRRWLEEKSASLDQRNSRCRRLAKLFRGAGLGGDARLTNYFSWAREEDLFALYSPGLRSSLVDVEQAGPMLDYLRALPSSTSDLDKVLALEQRFFLADHNLIYTDKMSMAAGVEVRVPFLDLDLVRQAASIPDGFKQRGLTGKWVLKKAMEPYLPKEVIYRPKTGFGAPLRRWMRHELRELLGDLLSEKQVKERGLFDPQAVQGLIEKNDTGQIDAAYTLLSLMNIELWCQAFMDN